MAVVTTTSTATSSSTMDIASPVTNSAMDFFEKKSVLVNYEGSNEQEMFPHVGCRGPQLDFFITAEAKNLIELNRIPLSVKVGIYTEKTKTGAKVNEHPVVFSNNTLHTLFSHAELFLNGKLISHSNNCYLHSAFIETELTTDTEGKETWDKCQSIIFRHKQKSRIKRLLNFTPTLIANKCTAQLHGAIHFEFLECEKLLIPGVTLHLRLLRSSNNTLLLLKGADDEAKVLDGKVQLVIEKASLFVREVVVTDSVKLGFERALLKSCAIYPYIESLNKISLFKPVKTVSSKEMFMERSASSEKFCARSKAPSFAVHPWIIHPSHTKNSMFRGLKLNAVMECQPLDTSNNVKLYYITMTALGFTKSGNGKRVEDFEDNHFILVFDLTSTEVASKNLILFPKLTGSSLTLKLYFCKALSDAIELFLIGERFGQVFIDSARKISKNTPIAG